MRAFNGFDMKLVKPDQLPIMRPIYRYLRASSRAFSRSIEKKNNPQAVVPRQEIQSVSPVQTQFLDTQFRVLNTAINSKVLALSLASVPASTLITLSVPAVSGTIALLSQITSLKLDDLAAPDDNTDLNASTSAHGLLRKLDNDTTHFLRGDGTWATAFTPPVSVDLTTGQTASIGTTNIVGSTAQAGMYRVSVYVKVTTNGNPTDTLSVTIGWNDGNAQTQFVMMDFDQISGQPTTAVNLGTNNQPFNGVLVLYANASTAITYATTLTAAGSPAYTLRIRLELIG